MPNSMQYQPKYVRSRKTETLSALTDALIALDAAVAEADAATSQRLDTYNKLLNPKQSKKLSALEITRDNNERKYEHVAAALRERYAFEQLCEAMQAMLPLLHTVKQKLKSANFDDVEREFDSELKLNFVEACKLYKAAFAALGRMDELRYEWTLDVYLDEESKAACAWLDTVPTLPDGDSSMLAPAYAHLPTVILGRAMRAIHEHGEHNGDSGFLGSAMYATEVKPAAGAIGIGLREAFEDVAGAQVAALMRDAGWDAFIQSDYGDLQVNLGRKRITQRKPS